MLQLDDYSINTQDLIGKGSQAIVAVAQKKNDPKSYCAKIIPIKSVNVDKELKIINLMKGKYNDNIVNVHYATYLQDNITFVIIMDRCETDLYKKMQTLPNKKFAENEAIQIMRQIFNGYALLYSNCIIHRDIKPPNILIQNGVYKIADFGVAKIYKPHEDSLLEITKIGTPVYKAPELQQSYEWSQRDKNQLENLKCQFNNKGQLKKSTETADLKLHHKVDIYSFGILFFHMLTGEYPYSVNDQGQSLYQFLDQIKSKPFKVPQKYGISQKMQVLIERMLNHSPLERIGFEEIIKMPEFNIKLPTIVNYKQFVVPANPPPQYVFKPNFDSNKDIIDWLNNFRQSFIWKCNENPLVTNTQRNYCDALLQLTATTLSNLGTIQNLETQIAKLQKLPQEIPFTIVPNLQKSYYITQFINLAVIMMNQGIFKYDKNREYGDEYIKFMYTLYKLANRHYDYKCLDAQPAIFKQQIMSDDQVLSKQGMKIYLDSL